MLRATKHTTQKDVFAGIMDYNKSPLKKIAQRSRDSSGNTFLLPLNKKDCSE